MNARALSVALAALTLSACGDSVRPRPAPDAASVEQTAMGERAPAALVASFDGLGAGFEGPHGAFRGRNPSDNSLAVGPDHIVQTVNSRLAIFTKAGARFDTTGKVLYGPVPTNMVFHGFGGACESTPNGDAVVRYDQLADRWLLVMPIFHRLEARPDQPAEWTGGDSVWLSPPGIEGQPGPATPLFVPPAPEPAPEAAASRGERGRRDPAARRRRWTRDPDAPQPTGPYAICYAVSTSPDPMGSWYRYEFLRPLFPDYPRPAVWPDGYYVPTSTGDQVIQKHVCVVDRAKMLAGEPATEQCLVVDDVNFLATTDLDGKRLPPAGAPDIVLAAGGTQLRDNLDDDALYAWRFHVDWNDPADTRLTGPDTIRVAPYHYLCGGQLTKCVPQAGTDVRLDAQGDKIMARPVYRNLGDRETIVAVHSVATEAGAGGVRWYELTVGKDRRISLRQEGTFAPDSLYRWMASPAMDRDGNIGIGYSFGGPDRFAGQRFAGRLADDPAGQLTLGETVLAKGEAAQNNTLRWEDYTQTAVDPDDDCTIWYVGDYYQQSAESYYSTRIGAFRLPGCR